MPRVILPNNQALVFPDDMSHEDMSAAIQKNFPQFAPQNQKQQPDERSGLKGIGQDVVDSVFGLPGFIADTAKQIPGAIGRLPHNLYEASNLIKEHPIRATGDVIAGGLNSVKNLINLVPHTMHYLHEKQIPGFGHIGKYDNPIIPEGLQEKVFGKENLPGEEFLRSSGEIIPLALGGGLAKGAAGLARRSAAAGLYGASKGQDPLQAALTGALGEGLAKGAAAAISPAKTTAAIAKNLVDRRIRKTGDREQRSPQEAAELLKSLKNSGPNGTPFPISLGQLTNNKGILGTENVLNKIPGITVSKKMAAAEPSLVNAVNDLSNELGHGSTPGSLRGDIVKGINESHDAMNDEVKAKYDAILPSIRKSGYKIKETPNFNEGLNKIVGKQEALGESGSKLLTPDFTSSELKTFESWLEGPKLSHDPIKGTTKGTRSFDQMRNIEINLKQMARDTVDPGKKRTFNDLAARIRKDYEHNAQQQGMPGIQKKLEDANEFSRKNYYEVWGKKDIKNLLDEKNDNFFHILTSPEHANLIEQLPMELRNKIYLAKFKNALRDDKGEFSLSAAAFKRIKDQGGFRGLEGSESLLTPAQRKLMKNIEAMGSAVSPTKVAEANVPTGHWLATLLKGAGAITAIGLAPKTVAASFMLGKGLQKALTAKRTLNAYAKGGKSPVPRESALANALIQSQTPKKKPDMELFLRSDPRGWK